jgi:hypothetical protein
MAREGFEDGHRVLYSSTAASNGKDGTVSGEVGDAATEDKKLVPAVLSKCYF